MTEPRWDRVESLFHQALEAPPAERGAFLRGASDDADLVAQVEALLAGEQLAGDYFDRLAASADSLRQALATSPALPGVDSLAGRRVGAYRLEREVGRGGTSVVYLARRADGAFDRRVAVKLLTRLHGVDLLRRFRQEQRLLSALDHPNIARLHDGGVTEDGVSYFVMEYVDGMPIDEYCNAHRLSVGERLKVMLDVADAVEHAQRNLVVHRDLKPSNILVSNPTATRPAGQVKLLDFGIAKILGSGAARAGEHAAPMKQTTTPWMTPDYAAPEQIRGEAATTATDVYQLGVVLYALLTGRRPYPPSQVGSPYVIEKAICETRPRPPSRAVAEPRLRRQLAGDLDAIILRALQHEPDQRYGSAEALARDIRRYLGGLPVDARQGLLRYRLSKFLRRHRTGVAAVALLTVLLCGGTALHVLQLGRERDRARIEAEKAGEITEFLLGLFHAGDPREEPGATVTAAMLLDRGAARAETLAGQPEVQAQMLSTIGHANYALGRVAQARQLWERALEIRRRHLGSTDPATAYLLAHVGWALLAEREYNGAAAHFATALEIQRASFGFLHREVANSLAGHGLALNGLGRTAEAEPELRQALEIRRRVLGEPHTEIANSLQDLGIVLRARGDPEAAEWHLRAAIAMRQQLLEPQHPDIAGGRKILALLLQAQDRLGEAETLLLDALAGLRSSLGDGHPLTVAVVRDLIQLYTRWDRPAEAAAYQAITH